MSVRENNDLPFTHISPLEPVPVPGAVELSFGVLTPSGPERMRVEYAMLRNTATIFQGAQGPVAVVNVRDQAAGSDAVVPTGALGDLVSVDTGSRAVIFNAQLVNVGGAHGVHDVVIEVRVTQGGEYRFRDVVRFSVDSAAAPNTVHAGQEELLPQGASLKSKPARKSRKKKP